jgi:hypothetical protein
MHQFASRVRFDSVILAPGMGVTGHADPKNRNGDEYRIKAGWSPMGTYLSDDEAVAKMGHPVWGRVDTLCEYSRT